MGKDKQRTKGGVKPSNSGRTAELLFKSPNVGFDTGRTPFSTYVPIITFGDADFDGQDSSLSPEVRLVLRKLGKKDATTKLKAIQELSELFVQTPELCSDVLQYWPRIYSRIATDNDRKVRELSHGLLEIIAKHVGRNLAPHLKCIFPYWFVGQNDIFTPASSAASNAFKTTFSTEKKQTDTIVFCRDEILSLIVESIKASTAQIKPGKGKGKEENAGQASGDSGEVENYELRMVYASLTSLTKLVKLNVLEEENMQSILDSDYFWKLTKHSSSAVRRELFNLIASIANWKPSLIQRQCIKAISQSLREETSECLQSLWNCFLTLTLNCEVFTTDPSLTKSQLLKVCKKGFYGNASSLGPSILPLVSKIGVDDQLIRDLLLALQTGYSVEKSCLEKASILRAYAEILAYYLSISESDNVHLLLNEVVFAFVNTLIYSGSGREFAQTIGMLAKKDTFYAALANWLTKEENRSIISEKNCGSFIVYFCPGKSTFNERNIAQNQKKKSVKFMTEEDIEKSTTNETKSSYNALPDFKKTLVTQVATHSLRSNSLETFTILSSYFQCEEYYNDISNSNPASIISSNAVVSSTEKNTKLNLALDLIKTFPKLPAFLGMLSSLFESEYNSLQELRQFTSKIASLVDSIVALSRWLNQDLFCDRIKTLVINCGENLAHEDGLCVLRFILQHSAIFGISFTDLVTTTITKHLKFAINQPDDVFLKDMVRMIRSLFLLQEEKKNKPIACASNLHSILFVLWERLVDFSIASATRISFDQEVRDQIEFLIDELLEVVPRSGLLELDFYPTICNAVDEALSVEEVDILVKVTKSLIGEKNLPPASPTYIRFDRSLVEDMLNFTHLSYNNGPNSTKDLPIYGMADVKGQFLLSFLCRIMFEAKIGLQQHEECRLEEEYVPENLVGPVVKLLHAQGVCSLWREVESYEMIKSLPEDFVNELNVITIRCLEILAEHKWNHWCGVIGNQLNTLIATNRDPIFYSKLPLLHFWRTAKKMDLSVKDSLPERRKSMQDFVMNDSVSLQHDQASKFLEEILQNYFMEDRVPLPNLLLVIDYLNIQRQQFSNCFQFERIFAHLDKGAKQLLLALIEVVVRVLSNITEEGQDKEDFYSAATCWVSAWLKQCKKLPIDLDKFYLLWLCKLSKAVSLIASHARKTPKFATEYVEFHASNLYLPLYYLFLQLGQLNRNDDFLVVRTKEALGIALSNVPSTTIAFIEPSSSKVCSNFVPYLESERLTLKITGFHLIKKMKHRPTGGQESEDLPIIPAELNEVIRKYGEALVSREIDTLLDDQVLTYLLSWDALLTIHEDRSCNEFGSFSKEAHLLPLLMSILFFQLVDLIPEPKFNTYFETPSKLQAGSIPPNCANLVCSVLQKALQCLPYPTRWWWNSQLSKQRDKLFVEKFIIKYLSSKLAAEELKRVEWGDSENVTVYSHPGCNELIAHYKIEDTTVSLTVTLPINHPLGPISVKISDKKLLGKISHLLNTRSNSLAAGLQLWKENLDAKYAGHEECAICFFILHGSTKSLPKLACKTCNHKFHSACLLKWFNTSNKSECPLCRNLF